MAGTLSDPIGNCNLTRVNNVTYTIDRFWIGKNAIALRNGTLKAPEGAYFNGDFTITVWMKFYGNSTVNKFIDFGNGPNLFNIEMVFITKTVYSYVSTRLDGQVAGFNTYYPTNLTVNSWCHLSFTLKGSIGSMYVNGRLVGQSPIFIPPGLTTITNWIGGSNFGEIESYYDISDMKIFNKALTQFEIFQEM